MPGRKSYVHMCTFIHTLLEEGIKVHRAQWQIEHAPFSTIKKIMSIHFLLFQSAMYILQKNPREIRIK